MALQKFTAIGFYDGGSLRSQVTEGVKEAKRLIDAGAESNGAWLTQYAADNNSPGQIFFSSEACKKLSFIAEQQHDPVMDKINQARMQGGQQLPPELQRLA